MSFLPSEVRLPQNCEIVPVERTERASVYRVRTDGQDYFLKIEKDGDMLREAEMTAFLAARGVGPQVVQSGNRWILEHALPGESAAAAAETDPVKAARRFGRAVRRLHEMDETGCPVKSSALGMYNRARENYLLGRSDAGILDYLGCADADAAFTEMTGKWAACQPMDDAVIHGDCCLSNLILNEGTWGWVDAGGGGIGPRHYDLFRALKSLRTGPGMPMPEAEAAFRAAYGAEDIDDGLVRLFGLISAFAGPAGQVARMPGDPA